MLEQPFFNYPTQYRSSYGAAPPAAMAAFSPATIACMQNEIKAAKAAGRKANTVGCLSLQTTSGVAPLAPSSSGIPTWAWLLGGLVVIGGAGYWYMKR